VFAKHFAAATSTGSSSPSGTSSVVPSPSPSSGAPIGAIVGGVVGGIALLALLAASIFCFRRRRTRRGREIGPSELGTEYDQHGNRVEAPGKEVKWTNGGVYEAVGDVPVHELDGPGDRVPVHEMPGSGVVDRK
jgi:hypothetical protein